MPKQYEVELTMIPAPLGEKLDAYIDREFPYERGRVTLRRGVVLRALRDWLDDRERPLSITTATSENEKAGEKGGQQP